MPIANVGSELKGEDNLSRGNHSMGCVADSVCVLAVFRA